MNQSKPFQVLIVEDEPGEARLMQLAMQKSGFAIELHHAGDGREALCFLRREGGQFSQAPRPDLILLDLKMPGQSGLEFLAKMKLDERLRAIPVVVVTSSGLDADILAAYQRGAAGYLPKPTDLDQFVAAIYELGQYWFNLVRLPENPA
jgi:CheY-like chemotaxis protein